MGSIRHLLPILLGLEAGNSFGRLIRREACRCSNNLLRGLWNPRNLVRYIALIWGPIAEWTVLSSQSLDYCAVAANVVGRYCCPKYC